MDTGVIAGVYLFLKSIFPATVGSVIATWRKRTDFNYREMDAFQKASLLFVALFAIVVGVCIGKWVGGAIAAFYATPDVITVVIEFATALNGLKLVDSTIKGVEMILDSFLKNLPVLLNTIIDTISKKIEKIFGNK